MLQTFSSPRKNGFTLIEVMLAITLGAVLIAGLLQLFVNTHSTYRLQNGLGRLQENARFAQFIMEQNLRMTGYQGCNNLNKSANNLLASGNDVLGESSQIIGFESTGDGTWSPALPAALTGQVASGTDVVVVRMASPSMNYLTTPMTSAADVVTVPTATSVQTNDILLITDCETADIFQATSAGGDPLTLSHGTGANTSGNLSKAYQTDARVAHILEFSYYIKDTGRTNEAGDPIFALYQRDINNVEEELITGVENMQITYGLDTSGNGSADTYQSANTIDAANNWGEVKSINVLHLVNTVEDVSPQPQSYTFNGTTVTTPSDKKLRRQWDNFVTLRNRAL